MEVSVENTSELGRRVKVTVPDATVSEQVNVKLSKFAKEAHLKGFRPGKVPRHVIEKRFGSSLRMEVIEEVIRQTLSDIFEKEKIQVAGLPKIEAIKNESGSDLEFTAVLEVYPEVILADLQALECEKRTAVITEEDVAKMIEKLQQDGGEWKAVDREVRLHDKLTVDFARLLQEEGAEKEEQKAVDMLMEPEKAIPGLVEGLLGKQVGERVELMLAYPEDWSDNTVAGKSLTLWVTLHGIAEKEPLTEAMLAEKLHVDKEGSVSATVKARMEEDLEMALREDLKERVLGLLLEHNPLALPQALIEQEREAIRRELSQQYKMDIPKEAMHMQEIEEQAKKRVELGLLLNKLIEQHSIKASPAAMREHIEKVVARYPGHGEQVRELYHTNEQLRRNIERMVLLDQAVDVMLGEMQMKEVVTTYDDVMKAKGE